MDDKEKLARVLLGTIIAMCDALSLDFPIDIVQNIGLTVVHNMIDELGLNTTDSQFERLKDEAVIYLGGTFNDED